MTWFRNLKLSIKLSITVGLVLLLVFSGLIYTNLDQLYKVSLEKGEYEAQEAGQEFSSSFKSELLDLQGTLETLSGILLDARAQKKQSREDIVEMLKHRIEEQDNIMGLYTLWEPNAWDNNDKLNINKKPYDDATGRFIPYLLRNEGSVTIEPLHDYDKDGAGDYYQLPKRSKKLTLLDPYNYNAGGKDVLMTSIVYPIVDKQGSFLGIIGMDLSLDRLQQKAEAVKPLGGYVSIISNKGSYVSHGTSKDWINKPYADNPEKAAAWEVMKKSGAYRYYSGNSQGAAVLRIIEPLHLNGSNETWYVETVVPKERILETYQKSMTTSIIIAIISLLLIGALLAIIIRIVVVQRVQAVSALLQRLAEGDFTKSLEMKPSKDEFGVMAVHFNNMIAKLRSMLQLVSDISMSVGATSQQLTASAEQTGRAAETITEAIQEVAAGAEVQESNASDTSTAMTEMATGVQRIAESSLSVTESAIDVTQQTDEGNKQIQAAVAQMNVVRSTVGQSHEAIRQLGIRSEEIGAIITMITAISTQTNLLALNAGIEAARVGEHGKGFAVVATEVRKLAEQSRAAAEQIADLIGSMREETRKAVDAMERGASEVEKGVQTVSESGERFASITKEMTNVNVQIQEVSAAAEQMSASCEEVSATVDQLAHIAREASQNSQGVAAASEEQLASMQEISSSSAALSSMVQELLDQLSHFKV
ncbi:methyl-accepting chemotaxis protein [Paenibacillus radicis (ex Xue et al. 2023)]|uniref:Methyl-accepting chemotaxis protein n=1 Tax=Paenibacillus radicis (ex Xue et al. 2023) TaxID=2972489 RepID=A0ABT1YSM0_9BACL|nr:methyl-accepting chemotaxis protein [Paenibacillus radicis (ex Xue et al. 2023)]MCR8636175.1 methyl-accepting chemotaxis protein [Paenibacillus radicis (ex Xue et al. 2023)]